MACPQTPLIWGEPLSGSGIDETSRFHVPAGTVTFMLTDIDGSTRLWSRFPDAMATAVSDSYTVLDRAIADHDGVRPLEQGEGDSVVGAFSRASDALAAALQAQLELRSVTWPEGLDLRVRIALHTADAQLRDEGNYFGLALSRCARLRAVARGGQTVLSRTTRDLVVDRLPGGVELVDCGVHRLRDLGRPENVFALVHPDLDGGYGPLRSLDAFPNNLPDQLTTFVGRSAELGQLRDALAHTRLLTLTGAGGAGKTRLALQLAADLPERFPDGVWWVELAPVSDPQLAAEALAGVLGVRPLQGMTMLQARAGGDHREMMYSKLNIGWSHILCGRRDAGEQVLEEALPLIEQLNSYEGRAWYWLAKGMKAYSAADGERFREFAERSLSAAREVGEPVTEGLAESLIARMEIAQGAPAAAVARLEASRARTIAAGAGWGLHVTDTFLARARAALGDLATARSALEAIVATGADFG